MSDQEFYYQPIKRIRQACENCRRKKARCTGERPECAFCVRLGQPCAYSDDESPPSASSSRIKKIRRRRKNGNSEDSGNTESRSARLSDLENQMIEVTQSVKGLESTVQASLNALTTHISGARERIESNGQTGEALILDSASPRSRSGSAFTSEHSQPQASASQFGPVISIEKIRYCADLYFRYCHNQPYSLFHEASFRDKIELNEIPAHLSFALLASTIRYSSDPSYTDKNAAVFVYAQKSWKSIAMPWNGIQSDGELSIVQTILLLAIIDYTDGRTPAAWIKVGLAIRLAQDFRLMVESDQALSPIQQEERRRVFWSFYLCDKLVSCGRERPSTILDEHCSLQLPSDENEWRAGQYQSTPTLEILASDTNSTDAIAKLGPFAKTVLISSLLGRCTQYALGENEEATAGGRMHPLNPRSRFSAIHSAILEHESEFKLNGTLSDKLNRFCLSDDGSIDPHRAAPLALYHALFFLCQCLLYHPFLLKQRLARIGQKAPQSFLTQTFNSCRLAAGSLTQLMGDVKSVCSEAVTTCHDPFYGYCNMVAGVIHSMFLQVDEPLVRKAAHALFDASIQNLQELSYYWQSCGMMRARLEDFRANSERYASLIDPTIQEVPLTSNDTNDIIECLDYARMSTTPRRRSQSTLEFPVFSQLPDPFFEEIVNLLPLGSFNPVPFDPMFDPQSPTFENTLV